MIRKVWYEAIDPYYSDEVQTFIGFTLEELDDLEYEHNKWLGRNYSAGIMCIYKTHTIYESDCDDVEKEIHAENYRRYLEKKKSSRDESAPQ